MKVAVKHNIRKNSLTVNPITCSLFPIPLKPRKIDLNREHPCPCCRQGHLVPITLTEALGCDRCQQIFVVTHQETILQELSSIYPYKRSWRWTGQSWSLIRANRYPRYLAIILGISLSIIILAWLFALLQSSSGVIMIWEVLIAILLVLMSALILWLVSRR